MTGSFFGRSYISKKSGACKTLILLICAVLACGPGVLAQEYKPLPNQKIVERLSFKPAKAKVVIDTDAYNEVDDQFALVYAILSKKEMEIQAIYAAPFINKSVKDVAEGMQKSYEEVQNLLGKMDVSKTYPVYKGATSFLKDKKQPVISDAVNDLVDRAMKATEPLYVLALGAPTNIASALILKPAIKDKIIVVWLGGKGLNWGTAREYNLLQDLYSSQILFDSGVPLVQIPTEPVTSHLITTVPELKAYLGGYNKVSDYLISIVENITADQVGWSKVIWDISVIAYMVNPDWLSCELRPAPILTSELTYSNDGSRHLYKVATHIIRNKVFKDMYSKFQAFKD
jgi:purine nucleosidase